MKANTSTTVKEIKQNHVNSTRRAPLLHSKSPTRMRAREDATKNNIYKDSLEESEARYRRLFETAKDGILILDATTGQITDVNPFLIEILGYSHEELLEKKLWEIGPFKDIVASQEAFEELRQKKYIRYEELPLETKKGERKDVEFISNVYGVNGKRVIQCNIRDISDRKRAKEKLHKANLELSVLVGELKNREHEMLLINQMNDLLQTCKTSEEAYQVISLALGELFNGQSGGLAILHNSGQFLETLTTWGNKPILAPAFSLNDCWGMRRGQPNEVIDLQSVVICNHFISVPTTGYLCLPLVVQGETLGLFNLETPVGLDPEHAVRWHHLAITASEGIKFALSNLNIRETMHEQATHDPLTGLFNRRYLDVTLPRELSHARRKKENVCIAMLDIDNFKHFNDIYGHDVGDLVLRELARVLSENIRQSDIACRYGGEEFLLALFDLTLVECRKHLEKIFSLIKDMQIRYEGKLLATITLSAGIVETSEKDFTVEDLIKASDQAMYAAKRAGRNCIIAFQYPGKNLSEAGS